MSLHPQVAAFLEEQRSLGLKPLEECTPAEFRETMRAGRVIEDPPETVGKIEDRQLIGPLGSIPIRIYHPVTRKTDGAVVYYHGGGWVGGDLDTHDALCRSLANAAGCILIAVDYRLAPEHRYPAAAEDANAAFQWAYHNAQDLNINPERIAVCGDSAGGNLATVTCLLARDRNHPLPCLQVLIYPIVNRDFSTDSYQTYAEGYVLSAAGMKWFWQHYSPEVEKANEPYASPLRAENLSELPPALVLTAECDVLVDEGHQYAARLQAAGIPTQLKCYEGMIHGFVSRVNIFDAARDAVALIAAALQDAFQT